MEIAYIQVQMQRQRMCIHQEVEIQDKQIIMRVQVYTEMQYMKHRTDTIAITNRGTTIALTFLILTLLSSGAEAVAITALALACSAFIGALAAETATMIRSVRSWSHFNVTLDLALCKSAQILNYLSTQITGSNLKLETSYKKSLAKQDFF